MGFELSRSTANKVKALLTRGTGTGTLGANGKSATRFDIHVKVTGPEVDGYYPCVTTDFNCDLEAWNEYTATSYCFPANSSEVLSVGKRYRAINYGVIDDYLIFAVDVNSPAAGCFLEYSSTGELGVDVAGLAGLGLVVDDDSDSGTCDSIKVDAGCGLTFEGNQLVLDFEEIVGDGLKVEPDDSDSGDCPKIAVDPGCGLKIDPEGKVALDTDEVTGPTFSAVTGISANGCGVTVSVTPFTFKTNACGAFLGFEAGTPYTYNVSLSACCDCISDSDSGSSDSSSSSEDACAGWYCCDVTGTVVYLANCAEVAAYDCDSSSGGGSSGADACTGYYCCGGVNTWVENCADLAARSCTGGSPSPTPIACAI